MSQIKVKRSSKDTKTLTYQVSFSVFAGDIIEAHINTCDMLKTLLDSLNNGYNVFNNREYIWHYYYLFINEDKKCYCEFHCSCILKRELLLAL